MKKILIVLFLNMFLFSCGNKVTEKESIKANIVSDKYGRIEDLQYFSDINKIAFKVIEGDFFYFVINGEETKKYKNFNFYDGGTGKLRFYNNGRDYAFKVSENKAFPSSGKYFINYNGKETKKYDYIFQYFVSPGGKLTYNGEIDSRKIFVLEGKEIKLNESDYVHNIVYNPSLKKYSYILSSNGKKTFINGDFVGKGYLDIRYLNINDKGSYIYATKVSDKWLLVKNGQEEGSYDSIEDLLYSENGNNYYLLASNNGKQFIIYNGKKQREYKKIENYEFYMSGSNLIYVAEDFNNNILVVKNNKEYAKYQKGSVIINLDYSNGNLIYVVGDENYSGKSYIVKNGKKQKEYEMDTIINLGYSKDGEDFIYSIESNDFKGIFVNGIKRDNFESVKNLIFSNNKDTIIYIVSENGKEYIIEETIN